MKTDNDVHLNVIKQALRRGNASIMVGAGFSLNAENGRALKGWAALSQGLYEELHPGEIAPALGTSDMLRLAEEYHRAFSRAKLDNFLREHLPDEKVSPGPLHKMLLSLNWSEIFTTNYDTLLERAADENVEIPHYVVACREDIPESRVAKRRRIVKLHGSFPSQRPFIFTEEDYRQYPVTSAPFVNLVRQSMLENIFCLIGFSGDDPNFLQWIGWVRDMLETHTLPVYLFLDKPPSFGQERLLQSRHITPVILPSLDFSENATYAERYAKLFKILKPIEKNSAASWPEEKTKLLPINFQSEKYLSQIEELVPIWRTSRLAYPGWLIAPFAVRERLKGYEPGDSFDLGNKNRHDELRSRPLFGLIVCFEYSWRQSVLLRPLWDNVAETSIAILEATYNFVKYSEPWDLTALPKNWKIENNSLNDAWTSLCVLVLRWCRQQIDSAKFYYWAEKLEEIAPSKKYIKDCITSEEIQLLLLQGEISDALTKIQGWDPDPTEPYNNVRRAAWLAECGETSQAVSSAHSALRSIRRLTRLEPDSEFVLSREAWACQVAYILEQSTNSTVSSSNALQDLELKTRLSHLGIRGHDPEREIDKLSDLVNSEIHLRQNNRVRTTGFDIGKTSYKVYLVNDDRWKKTLHCFEWYELTEKVGYPARIGNYSWRSETFKQAAWWMKDNESQERVHGLMVRLGDKTLFNEVEDDLAPHLRWLTRDDVARLKLGFAQQACADALRLSLTRVDSNSKNVQSSDKQISFQLERYSRLVAREFRDTPLRQYASELIRIYLAREVEHSDFDAPFNNALRRTIQSLPDRNLEEFLPKLMQTSLQEFFSKQRGDKVRNWPDWPELIWDRPIQSRIVSAQLVRDIALEAASLLSTNATKESRFANRVCFNRIFFFQKNKLIDTATHQQIAQIIWGTDANIPVYPGIEETEILRIRYSYENCRQFKAWVLKNLIDTEGSKLCEYVHNSALLGVKWTTDEIAKIFETLKIWWDNKEKDIVSEINAKFDPFSDQQSIIYTVNLFDVFLALYVVPIKEKLARKIESFDSIIARLTRDNHLDQGNFWHFRLAMSIKENYFDISLADEIVSELSSPSTENTKKAFDVIETWLGLSKQVACPDILLTSAVFALFSHQTEKVTAASTFMEHLLKDNHLEKLRPWIYQINTYINFILKRISYDSSNAEGFVRQDIPFIRFNVAKLAKRLNAHACLSSENISWLNSLREDPLPEVRLLFS